MTSLHRRRANEWLVCLLYSTCVAAGMLHLHVNTAIGLISRLSPTQMKLQSAKLHGWKLESGFCYDRLPPLSHGFLFHSPAAPPPPPSWTSPSRGSRSRWSCSDATPGNSARWPPMQPRAPLIQSVSGGMCWPSVPGFATNDKVVAMDVYLSQFSFISPRPRRWREMCTLPSSCPAWEQG